MIFFAIGCCFFLQKSTLILKIYFGNIIRVSNKWDPDRAQHLVRPDLGSNCLQRNFFQLTILESLGMPSDQNLKQFGYMFGPTLCWV